MANAAPAPWDSGPVYRPPDARPEWEEPVRRPTPTRKFAVVGRKALHIDAVRAEEMLEDVTVAQARRALALRRRLNRATAQATRAVAQRERHAVRRTELVTAAQRAQLERERDAAMADLEAARRVVEKRLRQHAERAEAERQAAAEELLAAAAMAAQVRAEAARAEAERIEAARAEAQRVERERLAAEEAVQLEAERERLAAEEAERLEAEQVEQERLAAWERERAEQREHEAAQAAELAKKARRNDGRQRLVLANKLERQAALLRDYEAWAESQGLRVGESAGLSAEADRLGQRVLELRYG